MYLSDELITLETFLYTVTLRYNSVIGRHFFRPPYKQGALWDPVDLFDIVTPKAKRCPTSQAWP